MIYDKMWLIRLVYENRFGVMRSEKFGSYEHAYGRYKYLKEKYKTVLIFDLKNFGAEVTEKELKDTTIADKRIKNDNPVEIIMKTVDGLDMVKYVISYKHGWYLNIMMDWNCVLNLSDSDLYKQIEDLLFTKKAIKYKLDSLKKMNPGFLFDVLVFDRNYKDPIKIRLIK